MVTTLAVRPDYYADRFSRTVPTGSYDPSDVSADSRVVPFRGVGSASDRRELPNTPVRINDRRADWYRQPNADAVEPGRRVGDFNRSYNPDGKSGNFTQRLKNGEVRDGAWRIEDRDDGSRVYSGTYMDPGKDRRFFTMTRSPEGKWGRMTVRSGDPVNGPVVARWNRDDLYAPDRRHTDAGNPTDRVGDSRGLRGTSRINRPPSSIRPNPNPNIPPTNTNFPPGFYFYFQIMMGSGPMPNGGSPSGGGFPIGGSPSGGGFPIGGPNPAASGRPMMRGSNPAGSIPNSRAGAPNGSPAATRGMGNPAMQQQQQFQMMIMMLMFMLMMMMQQQQQTASRGVM